MFRQGGKAVGGGQQEELPQQSTILPPSTRCYEGNETWFGTVWEGEDRERQKEEEAKGAEGASREWREEGKRKGTVGTAGKNFTKQKGIFSGFWNGFSISGILFQPKK